MKTEEQSAAVLEGHMESIFDGRTFSVPFSNQGRNGCLDASKLAHLLPPHPPHLQDLQESQVSVSIWGQSRRTSGTSVSRGLLSDPASRAVGARGGVGGFRFPGQRP